MTEVTSLEDLLVSQMRDIYHAEKQLTKALPKMAKAANNEELRAAFENHLVETKGHIQRLEEAFTVLGVKASAKTCEAMEGLVEEGKETIDEKMDAPWNDAAIIATARKVEHYEMAGYDTLRGFAERLGNKKAAQLFQQNFIEEEAADRKLTDICESVLSETMAKS